MILTISTSYQPATDLGFLLHKSPFRCQSTKLPFGIVNVFYPEANKDTCTVAILIDVDPVELVRGKKRQNSVVKYIKAYQQYCWTVNTIVDLKLAPFHLLVTNGKVHIDKDHEWHMSALSKVCAFDKKLLLATQYKIVDVTDEKSIKKGCDWWEELTDSGGEGLVIKPFTFTAKGKRGLVQPAIKCRGKEYLRIIYGPEYSAKANLERLKSRSLGTKRSLALREFALGIEALERFVRKEPLRRVHECVFGILALESEPVDPRL